MGTLDIAGLAVAGASVVAATVLALKLKAARAALAAAENRPAAPPPPRLIESRRERFGLLWFPTLTVDDARKVVVAAGVGLPHCARCVRPLTLEPGAAGEWSCGGCAERRPGSTADLQVTDAVLAETVQEFLARRPDHRAGPRITLPKRREP